jgi:hypothetical protein
MDPEPEKITKQVSAERLLMTAVDLFFDDGDMLAIHVLSSAAHEVLHVPLRKRGKKSSLLKDSGMVRPGKIKEFHDFLHETQNFLKHGAKDPNAVLEYYKAETPFWLFDAIKLYSELTGSLKYKKFALFVLWFKLEHPGILEDEVRERLESAAINALFVKNNFNGLLKDPNQTELAKLL